jgi:hypothetical protein
MKKILIAGLGMLALVSAAFGAEIADIAWNQSNIETLRSFGKADVARFLNSGLVARIGSAGDSDDTTPDDIQEFTWADLSGNHQDQLVMVLSSFFSSNAANALAIYRRDSSGKISEQWIEGMNIQLNGWKDSPYIPKVIQDLNGDGKDELVIPTELGRVSGSRPKATWPRVYRLRKGKYVEASRDFAAFYDRQVLPEFNRLISKAREELARRSAHTAPDAAEKLASLVMARDKILRVIGRDPTAGERQAREWITGPNPQPLAAITVFKDLGDHEKDLRAAVRELHRELDPALKARAAEKATAAKKAAGEGQ